MDSFQEGFGSSESCAASAAHTHSQYDSVYMRKAGKYGTERTWKLRNCMHLVYNLRFTTPLKPLL